MKSSDCIAVVAHGHPALSPGGGELVAYSLFRGLRELGFRAIFIAVCPIHLRSSLYLDDSDEEVIYFDPAEYSFVYQLSDPRFARTLLQRFRRARCSHAIFHHYYYIGVNAIRQAAAAGIRTFLTLHEYLAICNHFGQMVTRPDLQLCSRATPAKCHRCFPEISPAQFEERRDWFLENFDAVERFISPSLFLRERYVEWGLPENKITVIENGLTPPRSGTPLTKARADRAEWVFGYFGQISPFKGANVLLQTAQMLRARHGASKFSVRVHGKFIELEGEWQGEFQAACAAGEIDYRGPYDNADVHDLMRDCDYIVVPSQWWENSPRVIQEAFAAQRPAIVNGIGGMAEKIKDGVTGFHVHAPSALSWVTTMEAAANREVADRLRQNIIAPWAHIDMARAYLTLFNLSGAEAMRGSHAPALRKAEPRSDAAG